MYFSMINSLSLAFQSFYSFFMLKKTISFPKLIDYNELFIYNIFIEWKLFLIYIKITDSQY